MRSRSFAFVLFTMFLLPLIPVSNAQNPFFGVQLTCEDTPELDVSPTGYEPVEMVCTIENTAQFGAEKIEITSDWSGGATAEMQGATGEFSVDAGGSEEFIVTFTGVTKQASSNNYEFEIFATVTEWSSIPTNEPLPQENDSVADSLEIATYGAVELLINDVSTRKVDAGSELIINLQFTNKGNDNDFIRVDIGNAEELKQQGFSFVGSEFVSEDLPMGATSTLREMKIIAPDDLDGSLSVDFEFEAKSGNDVDASLSEISIPVTVGSSKSSGSLTEGISEVGEDDMMLYGAIGGGVIILFLLIGVVARSIKKKNTTTVAEMEAIELDSAEDDLDSELDEFDDLFSDIDDLDSEVDEFDDLLDDF